MINKDNYEAFFLDYLEGNLSEADQKALDKFLLQFPHLKEELHEMELLEIASSSESMSQQNLKDIPFNCSFDDFCIAKLEGDLTIDEEQQFDDFLQADSQRIATYQQYKKTKLVADKTVVYPNKSALKKQKRIVFAYWKMAVAASILILMAVAINWWQQPKKTNNIVALIAVPNSSFKAIKNKPIVNNLAKCEMKFTQKKQFTKTVSSNKRIAILSVTQSTIKAKPLEYKKQDIIINQTAKSIQANQNTGLAAIGLGWKSSTNKPRKSLIYNVAKAGVNKINALVKKNVKVTKHYDNKTEITKIEVNTKLLGFSKTIRQ